jgi:GDP-L-fucose synthase
MANTVVFGKSGLVGSAVMRNIPKGQTVVEIELERELMTNEARVSKYLIEVNAEIVIMCSGMVGGIHANSVNQTDFLLENLKLQNAIIGGAKNSNVKNFLFLGSSCIYPKFAPQPLEERSLLSGYLEPTNEGYAIAKIAGLKLCEYIHKEFGRNFFSLMPTNLYGPNDNFHPMLSHVPAGLMRRFHEAKNQKESSVTVWGSGSPLREFMHSDDLANACWYFLNRENKGQTINIGTGSEISIKDFANLIGQVVNFKGEIIFDSSKPDGTPRKLLDSQLARSFGWKPRIELSEGLKETYKWFQVSYQDKLIRGY